MGKPMEVGQFYAHDDFVLGDLRDNNLAEIMNCQKAQQFVTPHALKTGHASSAITLSSVVAVAYVKKKTTSTSDALPLRTSLLLVYLNYSTLQLSSAVCKAKTIEPDTYQHFLEYGETLEML